VRNTTSLKALASGFRTKVHYIFVRLRQAPAREWAPHSHRGRRSRRLLRRHPGRRGRTGGRSGNPGENRPFSRQGPHLRRRPLQRHPRLLRPARPQRRLPARRLRPHRRLPTIPAHGHRGLVRVSGRCAQAGGGRAHVSDHRFFAHHCRLPARRRPSSHLPPGPGYGRTYTS
jgi:hypothetical protein